MWRSCAVKAWKNGSLGLRVSQGAVVSRVLFSSNSKIISDDVIKYWKSLSDVEFEKEYKKLKTSMVSYNGNGESSRALPIAQELEEATRVRKGKSNLFYASAVNNTALMLKCSGRLEEALDKYIEAIHAFEAVVGKEHPHYASSLLNLGILYKSMAERSTGLARRGFIDRANEALGDTLKIKMKLLDGNYDKDMLYLGLNMAALKRLEKNYVEGEQILKSILSHSLDKFGELSIHSASIYNSLGLCLKDQNRFDEALTSYSAALKIRTNIFGAEHAETVMVMSNLAELYMANGQSEKANEIQTEMLEILEKRTNGIKKDSPVEEVAAEEAKTSNLDGNNPVKSDLDKMFDVKVYKTFSRKGSNKSESK